jgi:predicted ribosome quality control (RQC) complex YloA/Tae2 family protein
MRSRLTKTIRQQRTLKEHLHEDLARHGDPEAHKRIGDLLLANIATAVRDGNKVTITDYYTESAPKLEIEVDENRSLQDEAAVRFRQYTKAKRAAEEIAERLQQIDRETAALDHRLQQLDKIIQSRDEAALESFEKPAPAPKVPAKKRSKPEKIAGVRRYLSTDGYEILVGRAARDNDNLTFRVAQPNDLWMHTGDYPGSHVVVRNPTRKEIPQRTIIEAAQLAGRFSQASEDAKVVVHYTERKFLSKPKGAAPGLVRLSRFRSITVEPKESIERL